MTVIKTHFVTQSCTKEYARIEGIGSITTQTLNLRDFSGISAAGADDVVISYGPEQKVEVTGHSNIFDSKLIRNILIPKCSQGREIVFKHLPEGFPVPTIYMLYDVLMHPVFRLIPFRILIITD